MLSWTRWIWIVVALAGLAGCSFEGATGDPTAAPSTGDPVMNPGSGNGSGSAPAPLRCEDFKAIEESRYIIIPESLSWSAADTRCKQIAGAHLATFETLAEVTAVVTGIPLGATKVWTGVTQTPPFGGFGAQDNGWANQLGTARTALPGSFPWRQGEPNDGNGSYFEDNDENHADLGMDAKFDDANQSRTNHVLCECVLADDD